MTSAGIDAIQKTPTQGPRSKTGNLPSQATPFLGREKELGDLAALLGNPSCRLLTLVGPGGVGKTRLGLQFAGLQSGNFKDGVYYLHLAPVQSSENLVSTLADALGFFFFGQEDHKKQIQNYLSDKEILLVMDNFEHLMDEADWLAELLADAEKIKILVTSRESLGVRGEKKYDVNGLDYPAADDETEIQNYGSARLFLQEAGRVSPGFKLEEDQKDALARLCRLLEGMPLGIELAAAWTQTLRPSEIVDQVLKNRDFLSGSHGHLQERHRSMRAVFEHSWAMLAADKKAALKKLSVFRGGFTEEAASIAAGTLAPTLMLLADKSFLRRAGKGRYEMHALLKQFAEEKLSEALAEWEEARKKHCAFYGQFVMEWSSLLSGPRQREALAEIGADIENVRMAWDSSLRMGLAREMEMFLEGFYSYLEFWGLNQEGMRAFGEAAEKTGERADQAQGREKHSLLALYGELLSRQGRFFYRLGKYDKATESLRKSLELLRQYGTTAQVVFSINHLCFVLSLGSGDFKETKKLLEEALGICRHEGDRPGTALSLKNLGYINWRLGHYGEARTQLEESLAVSTQIGEPHSIAVVLTEMVNLAFDQSRYEEARELCGKCLKIYGEIGHRNAEAWTLGKLGNVNWALGEYGEAIRFYTESHNNFRKMGDPEGMGWAKNSLGQALRSKGDFLQALECYREGMELYQKTSHRWGTAWSLANLGSLESLLGRLDEAEQHLGEAYSTFKEIGNPWGTAYALDGLGTVSLLRGLEGQAESRYQESLSIFKNSGNKREMAIAYCHMGELALHRGDKAVCMEHFRLALDMAVEVSAAPVGLKIMADLCLANPEGMETTWVSALHILENRSAEQETREKAAQVAEWMKSQVSPETIASLGRIAASMDWKSTAQTLLGAMK
ncbi:MAG TPA: tetratricopeptide repeat protein [bacterium]|nr:tetratricopeptide repeat protein [bacterium]